MNGPRPSRVVFLSDLRKLPIHSKVRFLGCVSRYDVGTGRLILQHRLQDQQQKSRKVNIRKSAPTIPVDINNLLETIKREQLDVGAWLSVIGYIREDLRDGEMPGSSKEIYVEAVMVLSADAINVAEYERTLRDMLEVERRIRGPGQNAVTAD